MAEKIAIVPHQTWSNGIDNSGLPVVTGAALGSETGAAHVREIEMAVSLAAATTIQVPQDQSTIQAVIDAAQDGDLVLVSPGIYNERLTIANKTITLASKFHTTNDEQFIGQTIIDGNGRTVITVDATVGPQTKIIGFTVQNGEDGISARAKLYILNNRFTGHSDAIDYESGGGGICRDNLFENNSDDAIDLDGSVAAIIEDNIIRNNGDDGIEIRLHRYSGPTLDIIIRNNTISGNDEDGIQLIDYSDLSDRVFHIERNLFENNAMVGIGLMDNGDTTEDFRAASIPERIHLFNNTFVNNPYGVTGGDNLIALNNLFVNSANIALKEVDGESVVAYNLFWNNGIDEKGSNIDSDTTLFVDPLLESDYRLKPDSPAIDAGTAQYTLGSGETVLDLPASAYAGSDPDLGMFENNFAPDHQTPTISAPADGASFDQGEIVIFTGSVSDPEDGDVTASLVWVSDLDGTIGVGGTFARTDLTVGLHTVTATTIDSDNLSGQAQIALTVNGVDKVSVLEVRVSAGEDDAEEQSNGSVDLKSSDLEFVYDHSDQTVGMRFNGVTLPQGAHIANAYIRFERDETHSGATSLTIHGEAADNADSFSSANGNISSRPKTSAAASWEPLPWTTVGEAQRTTNIAHVIEEIINRPGWTSGNSLVLIVTGSGERVAKSYNGDAAGAPLLHIENQTPTVTISAPANNASFDQGASISFSASASDSEDGDVMASLVWVSNLDGTIGAGETFARTDLSVGMHTITATASDSGDLSGQAQIALTVNVPNSSPTATISAPANNASFDQGASISFSASASDPEDGDITASLVWVSNLDGTIGAGRVFTRTDLSVGMHTITATASDSGALSSQAQITMTLNLPNSSPTVTISAPANNASFDQNASISFGASASDPEDGDITASLVWVSDLDGTIGAGGAFARTDLSVGLHTITATATDSGGQAQIALTVLEVSVDAAVLVGAGDISICSNDYDLETSLLLDDIVGIVFTLGDNVYPKGTDAEFNDCYDPTWGRHKARTRPATGNHDYYTSAAAGYFNYFGLTAGDPDKGYYSYDVGDWHIIVLNTNCSEVGGCESDSVQGQWLQADLAANQTDCTLAYWHSPRFSSGARHGGSTRSQDFWQILYDAGADVVLSGHEHSYERFAPQDPSGVADPTSGIREFVVGTGGKSLHPFDTPEPNSEVRESDTYGVLKLTLHPTAYDWEFIPIAGQTFTDSGSASCVGALHPNQAPTVIISAPTDDASFGQEESIAFTGGANDPEDGDVTATLVWVSSIDGKIGMDGSFARSNLSVGVHTITATATDSGNLSGQAHISLTIDHQPNYLFLPVVVR